VQEVAWRAARAAPAHPAPGGLVDGASQRARRKGGTQCLSQRNGAGKGLYTLSSS